MTINPAVETIEHYGPYAISGKPYNAPWGFYYYGVRLMDTRDTEILQTWECGYDEDDWTPDSAWQDAREKASELQQEEEADVPENYPTVSVDSTQLDYETVQPEELERVQVSFPDAENGYQTDAQEKQPLGWVNSAAIELKREDDSVTLSISVGDPRGAFTLTVRRLSDGTLVMHVPHPEESLLHMPLTQLQTGTYRIG